MPVTSPTPADPSPMDERLAALRTQLIEQIRSLRTSEDWCAWLRMGARLQGYSFENVLLIQAQRPTATRVAGYGAWQELRRQVDKGEHGIRILAPVTPRADVDLASKPGDGQSHARLTQKSQVASNCRVGYVWDVSQTHGKALPPEPAGGLHAAGPAGLWDHLAAQVEAKGLGPTRGPCETVNGVIELDTGTVQICDGVDGVQAVTALAHQFAHALLHGAMGGFECRGVTQVEADSVAYLVTSAWGLPSSANTFPPVDLWAHTAPTEDPVDVVALVGRRVVATASTMLAPATPSSDRRSTSLHRGVTAALARSADQSASAAPTRPTIRRRLLAIHGDAADFFQQHLTGSWVPAYLDQRALGRALAPASPWLIGHAPAGWTSLTDHLQDLGYRDATIEGSGLALRARTGHLVDRFRDRLVLAIRDLDGHVVAFVGRSAPGATDTPKYLNSPTTPIYRKAEHLLGVSEWARRLATGAVPVITEGPLDAIAVGLAATNDLAPVALCGTALTASHLDLLSRCSLVRDVVVALDADPAGRNASEATYLDLRARGFRPLAPDLPLGNDPADVLLTHGPQRTSAALGPHAVPLVDVIVERKIGALSDRLRWVEGRVAAVRTVAPLIATCEPTHRSELSERVGCWTGASLDVIRYEVAQSLRNPVSEPGRKGASPPLGSTTPAPRVHRPAARGKAAGPGSPAVDRSRRQR